MTKRKSAIVWLLVFSWIVAFPILAQAEVKTLHLILWAYPEPYMGEIIKKFEEKNPNIRVVMDVVSFRELYDKVTVTLMGKGKVDMMFTMAPWLVAWAREGFLLNLDKYLSKLDKGDFYESVLRTSRYQDSLYGVPFQVHNYAMLYNKDMFEKAGIDPNKPPTTWEEFLSYCKKLSNPPKQYGFGLCGVGNSSIALNILPLVWQNKGDVLNEDCTRAVINEKPAVEAIQFWGDLLVKHNVVPKGSVGNSDGEVMTLFSQRIVATQWIGQYGLDNIREQAPELLDRGLVGSAPLPKGRQMAGCMNVFSIMIAAHTEYVKECSDFVTFVASPEMISQYCPASPPIKSVAKEPRFHTPLLKAFTIMLPYSRSTPAIPQWELLERDIVAGCQSVLLGEEKAQQAMDKVAAKINKILTEE